jgi:hypothetical protein
MKATKATSSRRVITATVTLPCCPGATEKARVRVNHYTFQVVGRTCPQCGRRWELCFPRGASRPTDISPDYRRTGRY